MKVIQIGLGNFGNVWLDTVLASPQVEHAGFVEPNEAVAREKAARYGLDPALIFCSLDEALAAVSADGVISVVPPAAHRDIAITALQAGIPVLTEKPLADSMTAAWEMVQKSAETGLLLMVAQDYRYKIPIQTVKKVLDSGQLGAVGSITVTFFKGPHLRGFHRSLPYPLLIDMSIHHFDLMRFFLGSDPVAVYGKSWNPPWSWFEHDACASALFEFPAGVLASYNGSWCATGQETSWIGDWRFECANGVVLLQNDRVLVQRRTDALHDYGAYQQYINEPPLRVRPVRRTLTGQAYLLHEFYEAVTMGKPVTTSCQDNIKSLQMVFDAIQSSEMDAVVRS